jgi:hypothetical protein
MALTRQRGNALATRQRRVIDKDWTLARPEWVTTPARGNQKTRKKSLYLTGFQNLSGIGEGLNQIKINFLLFQIHSHQFYAHFI